MSNLKSAVKQLISAGVVVTTDALEILKKVNDPISTVNALLEAGSIDQVTGDDIRKINRKLGKQSGMNSTKKITRKKIKSTSTIPRRVYSNQYSKKVKKSEKKKSSPNISSKTVITTSYDDLHGLHNYESDFEVIKDPKLSNNLAGTIEDMVGYFQDRYSKLRNLFRGRHDITDLISIKNLERAENNVSVIGMLTEKKFPPQGGARLTLEDPNTEKIAEIIIPKKNKVLTDKALMLMDDTVICIVGWAKKGKVIANEIILPDIPKQHRFRTADIPVHSAYLSDIHVGSKEFLEDPMERFIKFLNGEYGNSKMKALGEQTKYVLFGGDVVDGVGIYPNQQDDLAMDSINDQYSAFASFIERIPDDVEIVIIPGNHDMVRSAEPQPRISPKYAPELNSFENVHMLPNPAQVSLHSVQVLMYHCTSLPDIINHIPGLPIEKPVDVMKHMLKARHLAPIWGSKTPIASEPEDHLVIDKIPDIFHGGHVHINGEGNYNGVRIINSGTMQSQTDYQKSLNIIPTPGQITITNLKDRSISRLDLMTE